MRTLALAIGTACGIGLIPIAPGTFGSLPGLALGWWARHLAGAPGEIVAIGIVLLAGVWSAGVAERHFGRDDPGPVVIDEIAGMMITMATLPLGGTGLVVAFLVFRVCDIVKPFPAGHAERLHGGIGVMMDDVIAGVWAHVIMRALVWIVPAWLLA